MTSDPMDESDATTIIKLSEQNEPGHCKKLFNLEVIADLQESCKSIREKCHVSFTQIHGMSPSCHTRMCCCLFSEAREGGCIHMSECFSQGQVPSLASPQYRQVHMPGHNTSTSSAVHILDLSLSQYFSPFSLQPTSHIELSHL